MSDSIRVRGARTHNLKNIDVDIPRNTLTVITGLSGSGKSSLAFDTIFAEGQRRYVESLSAYARQFLGLMDKPDVDAIEGLSPAISIDQKSASRNPRSTVGTVTEIYDYLRLLFAKAGNVHCPICHQPIERQTPTQIVERVVLLPQGKKILILAPVVTDKKGEHTAIIDQIKKDGFIRYRLDGTVVTVNEELALDPKKKHTIEIVVDRLVVQNFQIIKKKLKSGEEIEESNPDRTRLADSIELALKKGGGIVKVLVLGDAADDAVKQEKTTDEELTFSQHFACPEHGTTITEISPRAFSFNSPHGACPDCHGLGTKLTADTKLVIGNPQLSISEGAILPWSTLNLTEWYANILEAVSLEHKIDLEKPWEQISARDQNLILFGTGDEEYEVKFSSDKFTGNYSTKFEGVIPNIERRYRETDSDFVRTKLEKFMANDLCATCDGRRLRPDVLGVVIKSRDGKMISSKNIIEVTALSICEARQFFANLVLDATQAKIAEMILKEIDARLSFLENVGLTYLTIDRSAATLSGGEAQRIRLATQIGSKLQGVLYVLDEPSIGLHQRDNDRLIETLVDLKKLGNTVLVVEHDEDIMRQADYLIDIGPGAGKHGGQVIAAGTPKEVMANKNSETGSYLAGRKGIAIPKERSRGNGKKIKIIGATEHNLRNVTVEIPLGCFVGVSGVSGSGKSSLINEILAKHLARELNGAQNPPGKHKEIIGTENLDKAIIIDQSPIGRTPRSNTATYSGVFTDIRELFATTQEAKIRGYKSGRFSFNVKGGRCEMCQGDGVKCIEMHFLPDVYVPCEECGGRRYNREALEITYRGKNIADVLAMTAEEALEFFAAQPSIKNKLQTLVDVGLSYLQLGQSATNLSGGEAQRVKLATELAKRSTGKTFYILDEPTTGLHFADVARLVEVLARLVTSGNTVLVIEHNLDVLKCCDYLLDLGPTGGSGGGMIVAAGTPEEVAKTKGSYTGEYLKRMLK